MNDESASLRKVSVRDSQGRRRPAITQRGGRPRRSSPDRRGSHASGWLMLAQRLRGCRAGVSEATSAVRRDGS